MFPLISQCFSSQRMGNGGFLVFLQSRVYQILVVPETLVLGTEQGEADQSLLHYPLDILPPVSNDNVL